MTQSINIRNYGKYSSDNYGAHCLEVTIGNLTFWFSYDTVIAFSEHGKLTIRQNDWKTTTGKHLNWINNNKKIRITGNAFEIKLAELLKLHNLTI